jgi:hypothetical protein
MHIYASGGREGINALEGTKVVVGSGAEFVGARGKLVSGRGPHEESFVRIDASKSEYRRCGDVCSAAQECHDQR